MARHEHHERLQPTEAQTIFMPDTATSDLPFIPVIWGAFDPILFQANRQRLLEMGRRAKLTVAQARTLSFLSDQNIAPFSRYLNGFNEWTDVMDNAVTALGKGERPELAGELHASDFTAELAVKLRQATGNVIVAGRQHSILHPTYQALKQEAANQEEAKLAEFVYDKHIDTIINPAAYGAVTSASVYNYLTKDDLLTAPIIIGPNRGLMGEFEKRGELNRISKLMVLDIANMNDVMRRKRIGQVLEQLKKWGITHVTHTVDLDVLAASEGAFAVRYSPIMPYLGLGCQLLPDQLVADDVNAVTHLKYPTPPVRYLLQEDHIHASQNLAFVREMARADVDGTPMFSADVMDTDVGVGPGLRLDEVLKTIAMTKEELPKFGIKDGIRLKSGARYRGAIVEMCGYETADKRTSKAAAKCRTAIAS